MNSLEPMTAVDVHRRHQLVGHLDAHHGDLVRDGGDAHAGGPQGQGDVVRQIGQLVQPDALVQLQLVPGHRGAPGHVDDVGVDAEGVDGVVQPLPVGVELHQGLPADVSRSLLQQGEGGILIGRAPPPPPAGTGHPGPPPAAAWRASSRETLAGCRLPGALARRAGAAGGAGGLTGQTGQARGPAPAPAGPGSAWAGSAAGSGTGAGCSAVRCSAPGQHLVRSGDTWALRLKKLPFFFISGAGSGRLAHQGAVLHRDVDVRPAGGGPERAPGRQRRSSRLLRRGRSGSSSGSYS